VLPRGARALGKAETSVVASSCWLSGVREYDDDVPGGSAGRGCFFGGFWLLGGRALDVPWAKVVD